MKTAQSGIARRPFIAEPLPEGFCPYGSAEDARTQITRCIERQEGIGLVTGLSGTGKTLLCRRLHQDFCNKMDTIHLNSNSLKTPKVLFQSILSQVAVSFRHYGPSELRLAVSQCLQDSAYFPTGLLFLLDDAQDISLGIFEELRQILDASRPPVNGVRFVLFGNMGLDEKFAMPQLDSFVQRITTRCYLEAFNRDETVTFLHKELHQAGWDENLFSRDVCREIYKFSDGVPRRTNQLADHVLVLAEKNSASEITPALVQKAWRSLQQFPDGSDDNIPQEHDSFQNVDRPEEVSAMKSNADTFDSVEFGSLEDDFDSNFDSDLDFISESKPVSDSDLDLDPEHTIDFENPENAELSGNDEPTQIWSRGSSSGTIGVAEMEPGNIPGVESCNKNLKCTREITYFQEAPDGSPQVTSKSVGEVPDNDDWDMTKDTLEKQVTPEKKSENSPYSAQKPGTRLNDVPSSQGQTVVSSSRTPENMASEQNKTPNGLSEMDRLIFQSYLEETTQSFARLYRILEAMRAQFSSSSMEDFSPELWTEMHDMSQNTIANLALVRMAQWRRKLAPPEPLFSPAPDVPPASSTTRFNAKSILEEGSVAAAPLPHETSQETFVRQDLSHPVPAAKCVEDENPSETVTPTNPEDSCDTDNLDGLRKVVEEVNKVPRDIPPELQSRAKTIFNDLKTMDNPE